MFGNRELHAGEQETPNYRIKNRMLGNKELHTWKVWHERVKDKKIPQTEQHCFAYGFKLSSRQN